jgi:hypothetical protein
MDRVVSEEPRQVGAAPAACSAVRPYFCIKSSCVSGRGAKTVGFSRCTALGVTLVPWRREHDHRLPPGRALLDLTRNGQRVEEQQMFVVVDRIGRDDLVPRLILGPFRVLRLPVPGPAATRARD